MLLGDDLEYDSDDIGCYAPPCMSYHIDDEDPIEEAPELTLLDQSPLSRMNYHREKATHL
jgi:hypothetical protein